MTRLIVEQGGREKSFDLIDDVVFCGSAADCSVRLSGEGVAERHCQILKVDSAYRLIDLGSGETRVNGQVVSQHDLNNGDVIEVAGTRMTFRGGVQAERAAPAQPVQPTRSAPAGQLRRRSSGGGAARGAGAAGGRRSSVRGSARRGRKQDKEVVVSGRMQQAAEQRETMVRRRVKNPGLSGPATMAIAGGVVIIVLFFGYQLLTGVPSDELGGAIAKAQQLIHNSRHDEARAVLESIPKDAANYRVAQEMLTEMLQRKAVGKDLKLHQLGETDYQNNILEFIRTKVETENEKYKGDTAYIRVLVKRLDNFLVDFKGHKREAEVKALLVRFRPQVPSTPMTWHDIAVDADIERARQKFGPAYKAVSEWLAANPDGDEYEVKQAGRVRDKIVRGANQWWAEQDKRAKENIRSDRLSDAYAKYLTAVRRFEGWPEMHGKAKKMADDLKTRAGNLIVEK